LPFNEKICRKKTKQKKYYYIYWIHLLELKVVVSVVTQTYYYILKVHIRVLKGAKMPRFYGFSA